MRLIGFSFIAAWLLAAPASADQVTESFHSDQGEFVNTSSPLSSAFEDFADTLVVNPDGSYYYLGRLEDWYSGGFDWSWGSFVPNLVALPPGSTVQSATFNITDASASISGFRGNDASANTDVASLSMTTFCASGEMDNGDNVSPFNYTFVPCQPHEINGPQGPVFGERFSPTLTGNFFALSGPPPTPSTPGFQNGGFFEVDAFPIVDYTITVNYAPVPEPKEAFPLLLSGVMVAMLAIRNRRFSRSRPL